MANAIAKKRAKGHHTNTTGKSEVQIFSAEDHAKLLHAKKVYVAGFSSQGGGHTERMLMPLEAALAADRKQELAEDALAALSFSSPSERPENGRTTVVLVLPPHWETDTGNEASKLAKYRAAYESQNANVITVQSDKTILGFYEADGPSDNFRILEEFANKPKRDNSSVPLFGPASPRNVETGLASTHHDIVSEITGIVGDKNKITVFEDMDPYVAKAASRSDVQRERIVGQSNHMLLLDADVETTEGSYFNGRSDAFLVKANGNGYIGNLATVQFSKEVNTTKPLGASLDQMNIKASDLAVDVRRNMVHMLLNSGNRFDLASGAEVPISGCVIASPNANADNIDRGVYLYLNKYTNELGQHIVSALKGDLGPELQGEYENTVFVVCGQKTLGEGVAGNAMHIAQAANFDAVTAAGFGTSSEMHYLISNDAYSGNLIMMPVEKQHEQEANAAVLMPAALAPEHRGRVSAAENGEDLRNKLDAMVSNTATTNEKLAGTTMENLLAVTHRESPKATDKTVQRLVAHAGMTPDESRLLMENTNRANNPDAKAFRRLNKVMIPAFQALVDGSNVAEMKMKKAAETVTMPVKNLIETLRNPERAAALMLTEFESDRAKAQLAKSADWLEGLANIADDQERRTEADKFRRGTYANDVFILGY